VIRNHYQPGLQRLQDYLISIGRRKLIVPLYEALVEQDWGRELAQQTFAKARPGYHPMAVVSIEKVLN